ncbi:hydrogenase maturation nickel metallochaperone HypA [Halogranum amylolyticum]|nr:hydrogenase maturation nickel metallochaperone HypA [Halogranum amylolyticum]
MPERRPFMCRECNQRVSSMAYRSCCPECGGGLKPTRVNG